MEKQNKQVKGSKLAAGRTSIRVDNGILGRVRASKKDTGVNVGVFYDKAVQQVLCPQYAVMDNSDAFRNFLKSKDIEYKGAGHMTILVNVLDPVGFGIEWGIYKFRNSPDYETQRMEAVKSSGK